MKDESEKLKSVATIGSFDGVHRGHRSLLSQVRGIADERGMQAMAITFGTSPRRVLGMDDSPQLTSVKERTTLLRQCGMDEVAVLDFTRSMAEMTARDFMQQVLSDELHVAVLVIGYDHRFGHNRAETFEDYCRYGRELGIHIMQATAYTQEQDKVSSSTIRRALLSGEISTATKYMGYNYFMQGTIVSGYQVGRKIGFPTANLRVDFPNKLIPSIGVYAVRVQVAGQQWKGMLSIGYRPTINNGNDLRIEVHILDFQGDIYNQKMGLEFIEFLRPEIKFDSVDELIAQMHKDKEETIKVLG